MTHIIFWALAAVVALAPLPFASNRLWSWSLLALCAGLLLLAWAVDAWRNPHRNAIPFRWHAPASLAFALALVWAFAQAMPWLPGIAPHPLWQSAADALGAMSPHAAVSIDPGASITGAMRLLTYGAAFWLALQLGRDVEQARRLLWVVVVSGTAYALYGLVVQFGGFDSILWYRKWAYGGSLTSTFVNRNSFATHAGMVALATMGLLASEGERATPVVGAALLRFVDTIDQLRGRAYALFGCLFVVGTALLMTHSRAGIASTVAGMAVFLVAYGVYRRRRSAFVVPFVGVMTLAIMVLVAVGGQGVFARLSAVETSLQDRSTVWTLTREATTARPLAGTGLGTFDDVYAAWRDDRLPPHARPFLHAHNSYLENALELGVPGFVLLAGAIAWLAVWCALGVATRRRHGIYPAVALGALALCAMHAVFDFSVQIPAVALCLAALLGVGCAQANRSAVT